MNGLIVLGAEALSISADAMVHLPARRSGWRLLAPLGKGYNSKNPTWQGRANHEDALFAARGGGRWRRAHGVMMQPFHDSTGIVGDADALRARMAEDGYVLVRGLLPKGALLDVRRQMLEVLADAGMVRCDRPLDDAAPDLSNFAVEPEPAFMAMLRGQYALEDLNALKHLPTLGGLIERLFGEAVVPLPSFVCRNIFPEREAYTAPPHQDYVHIQGTTRNHAAWIPIGDCDAVMGGLSVAAGSHRLGLLDLRPALGAGGLEVVAHGRLDWRHGPFETGDIVVFNSLTVHRGVPNRSDRMRLSVDFRYQPRSEPMCEINLTPHRGVAEWNELYAGWTREGLKYYWKKHDLEIVPFDMQYCERRDRMAFEMAARGDVRAKSALQRVVSNDPDGDKRARARAALEALEARAV